MDRHDFFKMMDSVKEALQKDYEKIRRRSAEDPGTAGDQAEEDWANIFRNWLPATYPVITKGRLLFDDGTSSPQVDVLILRPSYPQALRKEKYILAGGVITAFECKLTLKKEHIDSAFRTAAFIKRKCRSKAGTPYDELNNFPIFGLLAHSHSFKKRKRASWVLHEYVEISQTKFAAHPKELLDIICLANAATLPLSKHVLIGSRLDDQEREELKSIGSDELISTMYVINDEERKAHGVDDTGAILASLIHELTFRIAFDDASVQAWSDHLAHLGFYGGIGRPVYWTADDLSPSVLEALNKGGATDDRWSKWCRFLP